MPRRNGTGPMGYGPKTGWGRGYCRVGTYPRRLGYGFGYGRCYFDENDEKILLENEKKYLKTRLEEIDAILENFKDE